MAQEFEFREFKCKLTAGYPIAGSIEQCGPSFIEQLLETGQVPGALNHDDLVSWIIARLTEITSGALPFEGNYFASDGSDFGYRIKILDATKKLLGNWGIVFWPKRIQLLGFSTCDFDGQSLLIEMLIKSPKSLGKCEVTIHNPDSGTRQVFGWDGYQYL
jgi:hypothetical protein